MQNYVPPFSEKEIEDAILAGQAEFEEAWASVEKVLGSNARPEDKVKALYGMMNPQQRAELQQTDPETYREVLRLKGLDKYGTGTGSDDAAQGQEARPAGPARLPVPNASRPAQAASPNNPAAGPQ